MIQKIARFIFYRLMGWSVVPDPPPFPKKFVIPVVPHTSNWDFPMGLLLRQVWQVDIKYVGKASLFRWPFGGLFKWLGGYPVDRSKRGNFVDAVVDIFDSKEEFALSIAPEGTRARVTDLKTGFYYIAKKAKVPLLLCRFDYANKRVVISDPFHPTDDTAADLHFIKTYFSGTLGRNPENSFFYEGADKPASGKDAPNSSSKPLA